MEVISKMNRAFIMGFPVQKYVAVSENIFESNIHRFAQLVGKRTTELH